MPFLIDGHNVIAALPDIDLDDPHDEVKLVMKLRAWSGRVRRKAIVVFDGGIPGGPSRPLSTPDVRVIFAARHHTIADRIIQERVHKLPDAPNWTVVSSDREVRQQATQAGARTLTAQDFADALSRPQEEDKEKPDAISAAEVAEWLDIFQEPDEEEPPIPARQTPAPPAPPRPPRRPLRVQPAEPRGRASRTIGEQLGQEPAPEKHQPAPQPSGGDGKPEHLSDEEVAAWLDFFGGEPETPGVPPPKIRQRARRKARELPVKKEPDTTLSGDEVEAWLDFFGGEPEPEPERPPRVAEKRAPSRPSRRQRDEFAPAEGDTEGDGLSEEDRALWHQLFGEGD